MARTFDDVARITASPVGAAFAVGLGALAVWWLFFRSKSPFNPENNATDASGNPVTAYSDVGGVLGWLGAATNKVLGGYPASAGEAIGQNAPTPSEYESMFNSAANCNLCQPTACSDPHYGVVFADRFRYPAGAPLPTNKVSREKSGAIQSWSARPHQAGNNSAYADAWDSSPPDPSYTLNVLVRDPKAAYAGQ